jgi:hypothetical protein
MGLRRGNDGRRVRMAPPASIGRRGSVGREASPDVLAVAGDAPAAVDGHVGDDVQSPATESGVKADGRLGAVVRTHWCRPAGLPPSGDAPTCTGAPPWRRPLAVSSSTTSRTSATMEAPTSEAPKVLGVHVRSRTRTVRSSASRVISHPKWGPVAAQPSWPEFRVHRLVPASELFLAGAPSSAHSTRPAAPTSVPHWVCALIPAARGRGCEYSPRGG